MASLAQTTSVLQLFSDPTRLRLTSLLADRELTVGELTAVTQLSQSRVSTHLGRLREAGVVRDRPAGASTYYRLSERMPDEAQRLWELVRTGVEDGLLAADRRRCEAVLRERAAGGWPDSFAGEMERHYSPGRTWESLARGFLGLVRAGEVADLGCGDGTVAQLLAPRARSVTCVDRSARLLEAAAQRLRDRPNVRFQHADIQALPLADAAFDHVLLLNVLQYVEEPARAVAEAARVLRPGGDLTAVTLARHEHRGVTEGYGHVNEGFTADELAAHLREAGLCIETCAVTSRERRNPHFEVLTAFATRSKEDPR